MILPVDPVEYVSIFPFPHLVPMVVTLNGHVTLKFAMLPVFVSPVYVRLTDPV